MLQIYSYVLFRKTPGKNTGVFFGADKVLISLDIGREHM